MFHLSIIWMEKSLDGEKGVHIQCCHLRRYHWIACVCVCVRAWVSCCPVQQLGYNKLCRLHFCPIRSPHHVSLLDRGRPRDNCSTGAIKRERESTWECDTLVLSSRSRTGEGNEWPCRENNKILAIVCRKDFWLCWSVTRISVRLSTAVIDSVGKSNVD